MRPDLQRLAPPSTVSSGRCKGSATFLYVTGHASRPRLSSARRRMATMTAGGLLVRRAMMTIVRRRRWPPSPVWRRPV
jgi:hypothetical protein